MDISAFCVIRNGLELGYPFVESILSILPLCDEFVISEGYSDDDTFLWLQRLRDKHPKIRLYRDRWPQLHKGGKAIGQMQTRVMRRCRGRWIYLLQADEIMPQENIAYLRELCSPRHALQKIRQRAAGRGFLLDDASSTTETLVNRVLESAPDIHGTPNNMTHWLAVTRVYRQWRRALKTVSSDAANREFALLRLQNLLSGAVVYSSFSVDFSHIRNNFQEYYSPYRWAIRLVRNRRGIYSVDDGWQLQGLRAFPSAAAQLPQPIIHVGHNFPLNNWKHQINAARLYTDLQWVSEGAKQAAQALKDYEAGIRIDLATTSPLPLPDCIKPHVGQMQYRVREELFD